MIVNKTACCIVIVRVVIMKGEIVIVNKTACCITIVRVGNHERRYGDCQQDCMLYYYCSCG